MATKVKAEVRRKREEAEDRQRAHNALSLEAKIAKLDSGRRRAIKERARLLLQMEEKKAAK